MTLSLPSVSAALISASMSPKSAADVAVAASTPDSVVVSAFFSGAAQAANETTVAIAASEASVFRIFISPPFNENGVCRTPPSGAAYPREL